MSFWVYILRCVDGSYYTGYTEDLGRRLAEHQTGQGAGYTATRCPVTLCFSEEFPTREEALASERRIKGWSRKKKEAMIKGDWAKSLAWRKVNGWFDKLTNGIDLRVLMLAGCLPLLRCLWYRENHVSVVH